MTLWLEHNTAVVLVGASLLGACAGVVGGFAILARRALVGDALAHSTYPGLGVAYLLFGRRFEWMLLGAACSGLAGIAVLALCRRWTRLKPDAAIAIVLSTFFGTGVVLASIIQKLPGAGRAGLDAFIFGSTAGLTEGDVRLIGLLAVLTLAAIGLAYKEFKVVTFDLDFALAQGWPARGVDFALMLLLVLVVVIGLPAVGVLMVSALLILPAAAARFWTERLSTMLLLAGACGTAAGVVGTLVSATYGLAAGPSVILAASAMFLLSLLAAPRRGLVARWLTLLSDRAALRAQLASEAAAPP